MLIKKGCTRRNSRKQSNINHTLKNNLSRHIDEAVLQTEHFLGITTQDSLLIATIGLLPKLYLTGDSFTDFQFQFIKALNDLTLIDEFAKPVGTMTVRIAKIIFDKVGAVSLVFNNCKHIKIEISDCHQIYVNLPYRNKLIRLRIYYSLNTYNILLVVTLVNFYEMSE